MFKKKMNLSLNIDDSPIVVTKPEPLPLSPIDDENQSSGSNRYEESKQNKVSSGEEQPFAMVEGPEPS